jgi:hypothetical protein
MFIPHAVESHDENRHGIPGWWTLGPAAAGCSASVGIPAAAAHEHHDGEQDGQDPADQAQSGRIHR